jgi:trk system potassium uptake protein
MNILVCGGKAEADYVLSAFRKHGNRIVVMNEDDDTAELLSEHYSLDVFKIDPTKIYSFEVADVTNFDLVVSLMEKDADNFVVCKIAKELFHIKKAICTVANPNNVAIFQRLGIDSPISASYLLTERIRGESDVESIFRTLSLEDEKIVITEVKIMETFPCVNQTLAQLRLPNTGNITCIFRNPDVIIPRGNTVIQSGDTIVIASAQESQQELVDYLKYGPNEELQKQRAVQEAEDKKKAEERAKEEMDKKNQQIREACDNVLSQANEKFSVTLKGKQDEIERLMAEKAELQKQINELMVKAEETDLDEAEENKETEETAEVTVTEEKTENEEEK